MVALGKINPPGGDTVRAANNGGTSVRDGKPCSHNKNPLCLRKAVVGNE